MPLETPCGNHNVGRRSPRALAPAQTSQTASALALLRCYSWPATVVSLAAMPLSLCPWLCRHMDGLDADARSLPPQHYACHGERWQRTCLHCLRPLRTALLPQCFNEHKPSGGSRKVCNKPPLINTIRRMKVGKKCYFTLREIWSLKNAS